MIRKIGKLLAVLALAAILCYCLFSKEERAAFFSKYLPASARPDDQGSLGRSNEAGFSSALRKHASASEGVPDHDPATR